MHYKKEVNYLKILTNVLLGRNSNITHAIGYVDTGNMLKCRLTGRYVAITTYAVISSIITQDEEIYVRNYMRNPASIYEWSTSLPRGMHLIPYNTICSPDQIMLAFDADFMFIDDHYIEKKPLIGISPSPFKIMCTDKCILLNKNYMKRGKRNVKPNPR